MTYQLPMQIAQSISRYWCFFTNHVSCACHQVYIAEVDILRACRDSNIVRFLGASGHRDHVYMVTEFMENGSLYSALGKEAEHMQLSWYKRYAVHDSSRWQLHVWYQPENLLLISNIYQITIE